MSGRGISSPRSHSGSTASSRPLSASRTVLNDHYIHRIATNQSTVLGSLYDARTESVLDNLPLGKTPVTKTSLHKPVNCIIMKNDTFDKQKFLCMIGIHDEPWLNSLLNIVPEEGMASVVNYSFPKSINTRFLCYYYSSEEQSISSHVNIVRTCIPKAIPDITATHVISTIKLGIQALIVLQLPPNDQTNLDRLLGNMTQQLIRNKFELATNEKPLFDRITITKIFSNIPDLYKMSTLAGICQKITAIKPHPYRHLPLEYTLRTIHWFYPTYSKEKAKYIPLEPENVQIIKQYLCSLSSQLEELKTSLNPERNKTLEERLNRQYDELQQQITHTEEMYRAEVDRIRDLVIKIRSGTIHRKSLTETLINTDKQSLQNSIDLIVERLHSLREKEQLIDQFDQQNIKYLNMYQHDIQQSDDLNIIFQKLCTKERSELILCSRDDLRNRNSSRWNDQYRKWQQEGKTNSSLTLVYADFTYTSFHLSKVTILLIKSPDDIEKQLELSHLSPLLTSETVQSSMKQPQRIKRSVSLSTSRTSSSKERTPSQEEHFTSVDKQQKPSKSPRPSTPQVLLETNEQSKEIEARSYSPLPPKQSTVSNTSTRTIDGVEEASNLSTPSTPQISIRKENRSTDIDNSCNSPRSAKLSTVEDTAPSSEEMDYVKKQCNASKSPIVSPPAVSSRTKPLGSNITDEHDNLSVSSPLLVLNTVQQVREQLESNQQQPTSSSLPSSSNLSDTERISPQEKQPISEVNNELLDSSSPSKQPDIDHTSSRIKQVVCEEDSISQSRSSVPSSPVPSARLRRRSDKSKIQVSSTESLNSSSTENPGLAYEQANNEEQPWDTSHTPRILTPRAANRTKKEFANHDASSNNQILLKPSTAKTISLSEPQLDCPAKYDSGSDSSLKLVLDTNQIPKEPSEDSEEQSESISLATSTNKQSNKIKNSESRPESPNLSNTKRTSPQEKPAIKADKRFRSLTSLTLSASNISLTVDQETEDNQKSFKSSTLSKRSDVENTSSQTLQLASLGDLTNQPRPSTAPTPDSLAGKKRRDARFGNQFSSTGSLNSSATESTASVIDQISNEKESSDMSSPPVLINPKAALRTTQESTSSLKQQSNDMKKQGDTQISQILTTPEVTPKESAHTNSSRSSTVKYINILLLGESGVGKSTFINALVNYQAFETFEQAHSNKPLVVMPVSFLMTVGDHFEEKIVRFGGIDPNEDHNHSGQSVTQQCRSYVIPVSTQTRLRIIDTPGMGDTRGLEQDDQNMQHILSFINNLSHLNAICILLKPNESRLNIVLRSYFTRLLNFVGESARKNIVFCFTNTRATFFAPGNTGPLLKKMISSLPVKDISFEKRNTFCFDSESFRYLVALQNNIEFDAYQQNEYQQSWKTSVAESNRLLEYICGELKPYSQNEWQSIEHAQFKINQIIRPMLETMRNILRNITLLKENSSKLVIKLYPIVLSEPSVICCSSHCPRLPKQFSDFWILPDDLHTFSDQCNNCNCSRTKHIDVSYKLEYGLIQYEDTQFFEKIRSDLNELRKAIFEFSQFYAYLVDTLKQKDSMLSALKRIIAEESQICSEKGPKCLNSTLNNIFVGLREEYVERRTISISVGVPIDLPSVYELIRSVSRIDEIREQMRAIRQSQERYLKQHEKQVS